MSTGYQDWVTRVLAPSWLQGRFGQAFLQVLGQRLDQLVTAAKDAIKVGYLADAPSDAVPYHGGNRYLERHAPDTDASYAARLADPWSIWEFAGSQTGVANALTLYGLGPFTIYTARGPAPPDATTWPPPDGNTTWWSRFWVDTAGPFPWGIPHAIFWGNTASGGSNLVWGDPSRPTWGSTATPENILSIRTVLHKWRPAHELGYVRVRISNGAGAWWTVYWPGY
ncbi:MAG: hypothetical protein JO152_10000 [Mycobacteriaceae bacterium]|nr:hypothetical protein [Mycobacteriaceae bacterium]